MFVINAHILFMSGTFLSFVYYFFFYKTFCYSWGGPLSQNWLDQQLALQKKILSRMLELGMTPGWKFSFFFLTHIYFVFWLLGKDWLQLSHTGKYLLENWLTQRALNHASSAILLWECSSSTEKSISFS